MKTNLMRLTTVFFTVALLAFVNKTIDQKPWPVPDAAKNKANPVKSDVASIASGKELYNQYCKSCHGTKGKGDETIAAQLDTGCGDFTTATFQAQTDGTIFYKTAEGRKDMPSFKKKIPDADNIWAVVNYMRIFR